MPAVDSNKHGQSEIGKEGERERADSLFLASLAAFLLPAERASGARGGLPLVGYGGRAGGVFTSMRQFQMFERTNGRNSPSGAQTSYRAEWKGRAESNGLLESLLAAMLPAACHCEAGGERMWSVTIFVQGRQTVDRTVAGVSHELLGRVLRNDFSKHIISHSKFLSITKL